MDVAAEWTRFAEKDQPASKEERADEEEFTSLVERNTRRMFRVAYSLLRNTHDAEDSVQEAFFEAVSNGGMEAHGKRTRLSVSNCVESRA